jgi:hypothetical protein
MTEHDQQRTQMVLNKLLANYKEIEDFYYESRKASGMECR